MKVTITMHRYIDALLHPYKLRKNIVFKTLKNICFEYLLESPQSGDSNKYPKHILYEEIRTKQGLSYISFCPLRILCSSKLIIMATYFGTNAVVVTSVHCMAFHVPNLVALVLRVRLRFVAVLFPGYLYLYYRTYADRTHSLCICNFELHRN